MTDEGFANPPEYNDPPPPLTEASLDWALRRMTATREQVPGEGATPFVELVGVPREIHDYARARFRDWVVAAIPELMATDPDRTVSNADAMAVGFVYGLIAARLAADYE